MSINELVHDTTIATIAFMRAHHFWIFPIVFFLSFGESLAFISFLLPATVILVAVGTLLHEINLDFFSVFIVASAGAFFGDWVSYLVGFYFKEKIPHIWPFKQRPSLLEKGNAFFERFGTVSVFIGRFFGPLRAVIPLVAGICRMNQRHFFIANLLSSILWAGAILGIGAFGFSRILEFFL